MTSELQVGDQVQVSSAGHDGTYIREPYWIGEIVWFSGSEWVGVRCTNLGHTIHIVDRDKVTKV